MAVDLAALKTELITDPRTYGYAPLVAIEDGNGLADMLNLVRTGANGGPVITIRLGSIPNKLIREAIVMADMPALSGTPNATALSVERQQLAWLTGLIVGDTTVRLLNNDGTNGPIIQNLQAMFPAGTGTRTRLVALAQRNGSRVEELFGERESVTYLNVLHAIRMV